MAKQEVKTPTKSQEKKIAAAERITSTKMSIESWLKTTAHTACEYCFMNFVDM